MKQIFPQGKLFKIFHSIILIYFLASAKIKLMIY